MMNLVEHLCSSHEFLPWADGIGKYVLFRCIHCGCKERRTPSFDNYRQYQYMRKHGTMEGYA